MQKSNLAIYLFMLLVPLFWGGAFGAAQHVISEIPPITAATIRFGAAGIILFIIVIFRSEWKMSVLEKRWRGLLLMSLSGIFAYNIFFFIALQYTSVINGSLIMSTTPVFITVGAVLFLKEQWSKRIALGLSLSLFGVIVVIMKGDIHTLLSLSFNLGDLLFLAGLVSWVIHSLVGKVVMKGVSPLFTTTITMLTGSICLAILSLFEGAWGRVLSSMSGQSWIEMIYMSILATVVAFLIWNQGVHEIGASKASIYMNLVPIFATLIGIVLYDSKISWLQIFGMAMVIIGVWVVTRKETRGQVPHPS